MKRIVGSVLTVAVFAGLMSGCAAMDPAVTETSAGTEEDGGDQAVAADIRPQDDYFRYINQEALDNAEFEYGSPYAAEAFDAEQINDQLEGIINEIAQGSGYEPGSEEDIIKRAYDLFMEYDFESDDIPDDLDDLILRISNASTVDEIMAIDAEMVRDYGVPGIINAAPSIDPYVPQRQVMRISQIADILGVPFTEYRDGNVTLNHVKNQAQIVIMTCEEDQEAAEDHASELAYMYLELYGATDLDVLDDPSSYEYMDLYPSDEVEGMLSNIDLEGYMEDIGYDTSLITEYCLNDPGQLEALNAVLTDENIGSLRAMELGRLYTQYARYIVPHYPELQGYIARDYEEKEQQAVNEIIGRFPQETDPLYVEEYYSEETDAVLRGMCDQIKAGYVELISGAEWLSEETRQELLTKLANIVYVTGSDIQRHDPSSYSDVTGDNYYDLYISYVRHNQDQMIQEFGDEISRTEVMMLMQQFNACYQASLNNITITVAITNSPFFDADADFYTNLGGLGMVIAHEMGHAFDSNCILFDSNGVYDPSWIPENDMQTLLDRYDMAVSYFEDNFTVFGVYHVDGEQTLGENYADLGAMECITSLCDNEDQLVLLFENYARIWCEKITDEAIINQLAYDVHSPSIVRVNAILSTTQAFYETYDVAEGDGMYIAPENRISRWY